MNTEVFKRSLESNESIITRKEKAVFLQLKNMEEVASTMRLDFLSKGRCLVQGKLPNYRGVLSIAGMLYDYTLTKFKCLENYWIGIDHFCYILLSDHTDLFKELNKRKNYQFGEEVGGWYGMQYAMFQIAVSDWVGLRNTIEYLESIKDGYHDLIHDIGLLFKLYHGFLNEDASSVEECLNGLENEEYRRVRQNFYTVEKDLSIITLALGRLAFMHGMNVEIDSKYVPKELLPFEPLEEYTIPYKFLRDFYREQVVDWRYDPVHPELQDWDNDPENPNRKKGGFFGKFFNS